MATKSVISHRAYDQRGKQIFVAVATFIICSQLQLIQMSIPKEKAQWEDAEVDAFLDYLISQRSKLAGTNFKEPTCNEASLKIAGLKKSGPVKMASHCKVKWAGLKSTYNAIEKYCNRSGCHWDRDRGASIQGEAAVESVWSEFIQASSGKSMKLFKNTGWRFYSKMEQILP
ncbi:uncharacterized protein F5147DRAFT_580616, partial [Suillus discolor]